MKVLVCGGRSFADHILFEKVMSEYRSTATTIVHGACPTGADAMADYWATLYGKQIKRYPAEWNIYGKYAGPHRNQKMVDNEKPDLVIAFPGRRGTDNMVRTALLAGIKVIKVSQTGDRT